MDILSHGLHGGIAFGRESRKKYLIAFLFGIGPDLLSFGVFFLLRLLSFGNIPIGKPDVSEIPKYVHVLYDFTHSFVPYLIFFTILWFFGKKSFALLTLSWPLHILVDMPTHSLEFFPTPFLWPISDHRIEGIPWSDPIVFIPNLVIILVLYLVWYLEKKKKINFLEKINQKYYKR